MALPPRESRLLTYSGGRLVAVTGEQTSCLLTYNPDGTLQQALRSDPQGELVQTFTYDHQQRLVAIDVTPTHHDPDS